MHEKSFVTKKTNNESDVIKFYDDYADDWDQRFEPSKSTSYFFEGRWKSFQEILGSGNSYKYALELGVGTGQYIERARVIFSNIIAVDGSPKMLEQLKQKLDKFKIDNVSVMLANTLDLSSIQSDSVDIVYCFGLLEHIIDMESFFKEINRVLRHDGIFIAVIANAMCPWYLFRRHVRGAGKHCSTDSYYTKRQLIEVTSRHGFTFERARYWGGVPAGIGSGIVFRMLKFLEPLIENSFFSVFLGGITLRFRKKRK